MGKYDIAGEAHEHALQLRLLLLQKSHPPVAISHNHLGNGFLIQHDLRRALAYYRKTMAILLADMQDSKARLSRNDHNIGIAYNDLGNYDGALAMYQKEPELKIATRGREHPEIGGTYYNSSRGYPAGTTDGAGESVQ